MQCRERREDMAAGSMLGHMKTQHGHAADERWSLKTSATGEEPQTYRMTLPANGGPRSCLVDGCLGRAGTSGDEDGYAGPFSAPACTGHCGHFGGGTPPTPLTMNPMRHAVPLACFEQKAPCHHTVN